jgi:hypothetical protein
VRHRFARGCLDGLAAPFYLAHQHRTLDRGDAKIGHALGVGAFTEPALGLLLEEKCGQLVLDHLEDEADILPNERLTNILPASAGEFLMPAGT